MKYFILFLCSLFFIACNGVGTVRITKETEATIGSHSTNELIFAGITSIDLKTDSTLRINWIPHPDAIAYDIFMASSGSPAWYRTVSGQASASTALTGLTPGTTYKFLVKAKDADWINDNNTNDVSVTMNPAPDIPNLVSLISPASPNYSPTPVIQVGGVKANDTIKLFTDGLCTVEVASEVSSGGTINLTTNVLSGGNYTFYASAVNSLNASSGCSSATAVYQVLLPLMPSSLALVSPAFSPSFAQSPVIRVAGVVSGYTVKVYSDSLCTIEVGSGVAAGTTLDIPLNALSSGNYTFYAKAINSTSSPCSSSSVNYTVLSAFNGISSIDLKTDTTVRINWLSHASASSYEIYNTTSTGTLVGTVNSPGTSIVLSGLTSGTLYKFRVKAKDSQGILDSNTNEMSVTTNIAPDAPNGLTLITPSASPGIQYRPTIQVAGVKAGDTIKLFSDNTCMTEVATGVATGSTVNLTIASPLADGSYSFYANARKGTNISSCSSASVAYTKISCPSGFIPVARNTTAGTSSDFCVMKFEAKNVSAVATSQPALAPWTSISRTAARTACTALGVKYDLISNPEWMTIAYDIEATAANWSLGTVGGGALFRGHTDSSPAIYLDVTNSADPYNGTGNAATDPMLFGREQIRTFTLSNGEVIWDFSGNAWEWIDWALTPGLDPAPTTCAQSLVQLNTVSCGALAAVDYLPANPAGIPTSSYDSNSGLGFFTGGNTGTAVRGSSQGWGAPYSGIFTVNMGNASSGGASIGFRCVYRP